jgi:hypothetical protein
MVLHASTRAIKFQSKGTKNDETRKEARAGAEREGTGASKVICQRTPMYPSPSSTAAGTCGRESVREHPTIAVACQNVQGRCGAKTVKNETQKVCARGLGWGAGPRGRASESWRALRSCHTLRVARVDRAWPGWGQQGKPIEFLGQR